MTAEDYLREARFFRTMQNASRRSCATDGQTPLELGMTFRAQALRDYEYARYRFRGWIEVAESTPEAVHHVGYKRAARHLLKCQQAAKDACKGMRVAWRFHRPERFWPHDSAYKNATPGSCLCLVEPAPWLDVCNSQIKLVALGGRMGPAGIYLRAEVLSPSRLAIGETFPVCENEILIPTGKL